MYFIFVPVQGILGVVPFGADFFCTGISVVLQMVGGHVVVPGPPCLDFFITGGFQTCK